MMDREKAGALAQKSICELGKLKIFCDHHAHEGRGCADFLAVTQVNAI